MLQLLRDKYLSYFLTLADIIIVVLLTVNILKQMYLLINKQTFGGFGNKQGN